MICNHPRIANVFAGTGCAAPNAVAEQWQRLSSGAIPAGESLVGQTRPSSSLVAQVECYDFLTEYLNLKYLLRGQSGPRTSSEPAASTAAMAQKEWWG